MTIVLILLAGLFMLAQDETARQNIAIMYAVGFVLGVALWIF